MMNGRFIEEEMNRFEAELRPQNSFMPPRMFLPSQMRNVHPHMGMVRHSGPMMSMNRFPTGPMSTQQVISAPPRPSTAAVISAPAQTITSKADDDDDDIMATLMKYEAQVKKETKKGSNLTPTSSGQAQVHQPQVSASMLATAAPKKATQMAEAAKKSTVTITSTLAKQVPAMTPSTVPSPTKSENPAAKKQKKPKRVVRTGGGQIWEDETLKEWDPNDFRIFCGDLGNDVTDEVLARTFGRYPSFVKAKVIRDKKTNKTKGFGFVSFRDPSDFTRAMKELNGKYVGSRPIKLRKSNWKDRNIEVVRNKQKMKVQMGYKL